MTDDPHDFCPDGVGVLTLMMHQVNALGAMAERHMCLEPSPDHPGMIRFKRIEPLKLHPSQGGFV